MTITSAQCNKILNTLPIGYYCGRKVPVSLDENEETSFYSPMEDKIIISLPIINEGLKAVTDDSNIETAVRSMLYHEISHVILTPDDMFHHLCYDEDKFLFNVFEDERIETLLRNYYMDVDFKAQVHAIMTAPDPAETNPSKIFFNAVRFRFGKKDIVEKVSEIINKFKNINRSYTDNDWGQYDEMEYYMRAIRDLYNMIKNDVKSKKPIPQTAEQYKQQESPLEQVNTKDTKGKPSSKEKEVQTDTNEAEANEVININDLPNDVRQTIQNMAKQLLDKNSRVTREEDKKQLFQAHKTLEMLVANFNKKNSGGSGFNAYSGIFNARCVSRDDYKFFERSATVNGNNKFGTCHLNLIIDCSGSFYPNTNIVNSLLASLSEIERKYPNFTMDVAFINNKYKECKTVRDRVINCNNGNNIPADINIKLNNMNKPNTYNYTIILFDGDALSDSDLVKEEKIKLFKKLDRENTCLITDEDNDRCYQAKKFTKSKVIVTKDYTNELIKNIIRAFTIMFN